MQKSLYCRFGRCLLPVEIDGDFLPTRLSRVEQQAGLVTQRSRLDTFESGTEGLYAVLDCDLVG